MIQRAALYLLLLVVAALRRPATAPVVEAPQPPARPVDLGTRDDWALAGGW